MSEAMTRLIEIVTRELDLDPDEVDPLSTADSVVGWDSLGLLRICMAVESAFSVSIPMARVSEMSSLAAIDAFLAETL